MPEPWSREEVETVVGDYLRMLDKELRGEPCGKAEHNRQLQALLRSRTRGSIERKHQNISAILIELGYPYIDGYKPLRNYQELLRTVVEERLRGAAALDELVAASVEAEAPRVPAIADILSIAVPPPIRHDSDSGVSMHGRARNRATAVRRNYLELEARNQSLGRAGEELVLEFEHQRLWRAGKQELADRIEHVAQTQGDGLGFDIHSFEVDGRDRLIEVKTTRFGALTPFYASRTEVEVSDERQDEFQLYRMYNFREQPRLFILPGSLRLSCQLEPFSYSAVPN
jgi:hypothetical protein